METNIPKKPEELDVTGIEIGNIEGTFTVLKYVTKEINVIHENMNNYIKRYEQLYQKI